LKLSVADDFISNRSRCGGDSSATLDSLPSRCGAPPVSSALLHGVDMTMMDRKLDTRIGRLPGVHEFYRVVLNVLPHAICGQLWRGSPELSRQASTSRHADLQRHEKDVGFTQYPVRSVLEKDFITEDDHIRLLLGE